MPSVPTPLPRRRSLLSCRPIFSSQHYIDELRAIGTLSILESVPGREERRALTRHYGRSIVSDRPGGPVHIVGYAAGTEASFDIFGAIRRDPIIRIATAGSRKSFEGPRPRHGTAKASTRDRSNLRGVRFSFPFDYFGQGNHFVKVALTS